MSDDITEFVRTHDRDRYLAILFAPEETRAHLLALYAFNAEINRIRNVVSDAQVGMIRLQWWRDTIDTIDTSDHPTAKALAAAITAHNLPKRPLQDMIEAHEFDLFADRMPSLNALEGYLGETESAVIQLACLILDPIAAKRAGEIAGLAGVAHGIAQRIPQQPNLIPEGQTADTLASHAKTRWQEASRLDVEPSLLAAFLHTASTPRVLRKSRPVAPWLRQWDMWRMAKRGAIST